MKRLSDQLFYPFLVSWGLALYSMFLIPIYGDLMGVPDDKRAAPWIVPVGLLFLGVVFIVASAIAYNAEERVDKGAKKEVAP